MTSEGGVGWSGRRKRSPVGTIVVFTVLLGLVLYILLANVTVTRTQLFVYLPLLIVGMLVYPLLFFLSWTEVEVDLQDEALVGVVREGVHVWSREMRTTVARNAIAKVVERRNLWLVEMVYLRDGLGRTLLFFPSFLPKAEHDQMIGTILDWVNIDRA